MRTRLEEHRQAFTDGKGIGPLLQIEDLTQEEIALISVEFHDRMLTKQGAALEEIYQNYVAVLHSWGVMCPHSWGYGQTDTLLKNGVSWYTCEFCKAAVFRR